MSNTTFPTSVSANTIIFNYAVSVLGLFNVVQFENAVCNTTTPGNQGVCYTSSECSNMGGRVAGVCAQGFGVCCQCMYMSEKVFSL